MNDTVASVMANNRKEKQEYFYVTCLTFIPKAPNRYTTLLLDIFMTWTAADQEKQFENSHCSTTEFDIKSA